jgi:hypothetical protein
MEANVHSESGLLAAGSEALPASADIAEEDIEEEDIAEAVAAVFDVLREAGVLDQGPRALLGGSEGHAPRLGRSGRIKAHMHFVLDHDQAAYSTRTEELAYLANTLMAGCSIQARPFTAQEASDAAVAVCNLGLENWGLENWGLENWPRELLPANTTSLPGSFLVDHDLVSVFQVGWAVLHNNVSMYAAEQLIGVLTRMRCDDPEIQMWLDALRIRMAKQWRARAPWRARDALDVIAILDMQAWAVLLALTDECPVLHPGVGASEDPGRPLSAPLTSSSFRRTARSPPSVNSCSRCPKDCAPDWTAQRTLAERRSGCVIILLPRSLLASGRLKACNEIAGGKRTRATPGYGLPTLPTLKGSNVSAR